MLTIREPLLRSETRPITTACLPLPDFDSADLDHVREIFRSSMRHSLRQAWLEKEEDAFAPAYVRAGWRGNSLLILAEMIDFDIASRVTGPNQRAWELGDTFEIFLQPEGQMAYFEIQVTPQNHNLHLRFTDAASLKNLRETGSLQAALASREIIFSRTWVQAGACWYVYAEIKASELGDLAGPLPGRRWRYSFSRYDYTSDLAQPVISSTSPHTEPDFHRVPEWNVMSFEPAIPKTHRE